MVQTSSSSVWLFLGGKDASQPTLDTSEILLPGPVGFGPDVMHGFPDVSIRMFVSVES